MARTRGSSAFRTTAPSGAMARTSALFSAWTPSSEPRNSVCALDTTVTAPTVGRRVNANAGGAAGGRVPEIGVAIELVPSDGEEDLADGEGAAVDGRAPHRHAKIPPDQGALGPADDVFDGERGYHLDFPP